MSSSCFFMKQIRKISQLQSIAQQKVYKVLKTEANRLERFLRDEIENYLSSYKPKVYKRTGDLLRSLRVSEPFPYSISGSFAIKVYFESSLAYHPSLFGGRSGYVPILLDKGWHWSENKRPRIYRLSDFDGIHFIKRAVKRFQSSNKLKLKVLVINGGDEYLY